jgi:serine/threonine protein kinase
VVDLEKRKPDEPPSRDASAAARSSLDAHHSATSTMTVVVDEQRLMSGALASRSSEQSTELIRELTGLEDVRQLGSSRFGAVRLVRRMMKDGSFEYYSAKFYNAGDRREGGERFQDLMQPFLELSHPSVMPIAGLIAPVRGAGPIVLTPYRENGSLESVLNQVRRNNPPSFWSDATKVRMIVSLVSGLRYLHNNGLVHRELKLTDLIVDDDGSLLICGYLTSMLEDHHLTRASQVGAPSYMAPEVYEDDQDDRDGGRVRDPKTDVFSFGLILYEFLCGEKVFPSVMSAAAIMRRAISTRESDRPRIPESIHPVLRELISRSWMATLAKRPTFETIWKRLREMGFKIFARVDVQILPLCE